MGTVAILAPRVQDLIRNVREQAEASLRAQELAKQNRPKIFVEGESDKIVLERCVKAFIRTVPVWLILRRKRVGEVTNLSSTCCAVGVRTTSTIPKDHEPLASLISMLMNKGKPGIERKG